MSRRSLLAACLLPALLATAHAQTPLPGFGPPTGGRSLPGFGSSSEGLPTLIDQDRHYAKNQIRKFDRDKNGRLNREEVRLTGYRGVEERWFGFDADRDDQVDELELANAYARTRIDQETKTRRQTWAKKRAANAQISKEDKANASKILTQLDQNRDRKLSKTEANSGWSGSASQLFSECDLNRSGYLTANELALHYANARRQSKSQRNAFQMQFTNLTFHHNGKGWVGSQQKPQGNLSDQATAAQELISRHDRNGNGMLDQFEWRQIAGRFDAADADGSATLTRDELAQWLIQFSPRQPPSITFNVPDWFRERDVNLDGQVSLSEFGEQWTDQLLEEFKQFDLNRDGSISVSESRQRPVTRGRQFASLRSAVIEPRIGGSSTIRIDDDFIISDLDVHLSITHQVPKELDAHLIGPDGQRVELFSGTNKVWNGQDFEQTILDEASPRPLAKGTPPFRGRWSPAEDETPQMGRLSSYNGKRSRGLWRLVIRADRSQRAGFLRGWSLILTETPAASEISRTR